MAGRCEFPSGKRIRVQHHRQFGGNFFNLKIANHIHVTWHSIRTSTMGLPLRLRADGGANTMQFLNGLDRYNTRDTGFVQD